MGPTQLILGDASLTTATFLFTDIEGSTGLWEREPEAMRSALQRHNALLSTAVERYEGYVFKTVGDAFCVTFDSATAALGAAHSIQSTLATETWPTRIRLRVRVALHTGPAYLCEGDYFGTTVNRCARLLAVTRGGQTLLTSTTEALVRDSLPAGTGLRDAGMLRLRDLPHPVHVFQLTHPSLDPDLLELSGDGVVKMTAVPLARFKPLDFYEVPSLPAIVVQAMRAIQDPKSSAKKVERVIVHDPAMSAKILRVANSAFFGFSRRVSTIAEAVQVLGFTNVQGMILSVGAFDAFRTERLNLTDFWKHSITTATAARFLSRTLGCSADEAFMAGLLHDIGKLIFAVQAEPNYRQVLELRPESRGDGLQAERAFFDFTHPEVGEMVAQRWDLPARYVAAIAHHHDPSEAGDEHSFCALIGLADLAAHATGQSVPTSERSPESAPLLDLLNIATSGWEACLQHLREARPTIETFVGAIQ